MTVHPSSSEQPKIPALPKAGGAIQSQGSQWGPVGAKGEACLDLPLPISPGRGFAPSMTLSYRSSQGNGPFGLGWAVAPSAISRDTRKGVPAYTQDDRFISPHGIDLVPERDADGAIRASNQTHYNGLPLAETYRVVRYFPVIEGRFERIEHWSASTDSAGFWLLQGADGTVHLFGKTAIARCADPGQHAHVAQWLLQESLNPLGEHIYYHYKQEDQSPGLPRDYRAQRYLARVCYGNRQHRTHLALWNSDSLVERQWHFELVFDFGERDTGLTQVPTYAEQYPWPRRKDPFSSYAYGFELGTQRLCRQVLMFHYFPGEPGMGSEPVLTRRLLLEYSSASLIGSCLRALHTQAYDPKGNACPWPPLELAYSTFKPAMDSDRYQGFDSLAGLDDGHHYQLVDLYNDGLPGVLHRTDKSWYYREPLRGASADEVSYGPWKELPRIPLSDTTQTTRQALADLNGDGQLEWVVAQPGLSGFFSLDADRQWSGFTPFAALPQEFFHPHGQLADLMGGGLYDLVMIGNRSVRLYANRQHAGYAAGQEVPHEVDDDALPTLTGTPAELIAFCDLLGSGQPQLVRIRHNEVKCWPNLGRGRFAKGFVFATLPFAYDRFDAANIRLADLDGSGAVDLLYLEPERALIYMNQAGGGLAPPLALPWPDGVQHDATCQVSLADLQGLGCASLILSVPHMTPRHWRYDFVRQKPYLLTETVNNMGASTKLSYRSSAQEWLDEKQTTSAGNGLPFPVHVVTRQRQTDLVSGDQLNRHYRYREPCYDSIERQFIGFGLLLETDTATPTAGLLAKRWFHTFTPPREPFYTGDTQAPALGLPLLSSLEAGRRLDTLITHPSAALQRALKRALSGNLLREETYAAADVPQAAVPYSVQQQRYLVRQLHPSHKAGEPEVLLPLLVESISCQYERQHDDPRCQHRLNLRWDRYGGLEHSVVVDYARRKTAGDSPPPGPAHAQQWWRDAHDAAQQAWYLNESRASFIHLDEPQRWRLHLPYQQRDNVLVLAKDQLSSGQISYERFSTEGRSNPLGPDAERQLGGLSVQHYCLADCASPLPPGSASLQALPAYVEVAELDGTALAAYEDSTRADGAPLFDLSATLSAKHYRRLSPVLSAAPGQDTDLTLWSVGQGYTRYGQATEFYRPRRYQTSLSHGVMHTEYDACHLYVTKVQTADGCTTQAEYDYRLGLPVTVTDAQGTRQQACYDAHGYLIATSLLGEEHGKPVGADIRQTFTRASDIDPTQALADPQSALLNAQVACVHAVFSWMGRVPPASVQAQWVQSGYLLPSGHIRASALARVNRQPQLHALKALIQAARREPVHVAVLQADRLRGAPGDSEGNIRIALAYTDGFGRVRQTEEKAQAGPAFKVDDNGRLSVDAEQKPIEVHSQDRWRVSGRVEYDHRGLVARTWRPWFAHRAGYLKDEALKALSPGEQHFHDALGRPVRVLNANGDSRRQTYLAWYTVSEDENDTHAD